MKPLWAQTLAWIAAALAALLLAFAAPESFHAPWVSPEWPQGATAPR